MDNDINKLRKEVLEYFKKNRITGRKFISVPIQKMVSFSPKGLKHLVSRTGKDAALKLQLAKSLPKLLSDSFYMGFEKDIKERKDVLGVHNYYSMGIYQGKIYEVWIKIKETKSSTFIYDMGIIKEVK